MRHPPGSTQARFDELSGLNRALSTAMIVFHEAVSRRLGLTAGDRKCLGVLAELKRATPGRLARATGLTTGAFTGVVDRLERAGFARRIPNPADRRSILVEVQREDELAALATPVFASLTQAMESLYARFSAEELTTIERYLAETVEVLRAETAALLAPADGSAAIHASSAAASRKSPG
jgi:DNA-binding MarR family transcriptional regulator